MGAHSPASTHVTLLHRLNAEPGNQRNWDEFVRLYGPVIRNWCLHWGLQECDANDVTQNVLFRLTSRLPQFQYDRTKSFRGWLKTLTHHAWHDFISESGYRHRAQGDSVVFDLLQSAAAKDDLTARVDKAFDLELLELAVAEVRKRVAGSTWEAFKLIAFEGMGSQEVADQLGLRVSQVYLAKHRVQKMLQEELQALEGRA
jgi:RNA polymerase sigma-70 factor (ECF subfamily)